MDVNPKQYENPHLVITPQALAARLDAGVVSPRETPTLLLDLRPAEEFAHGHLPHAVHLDLFGISLVDTNPAPLRAFLWIIEHLLASRGVSGDRPVVVYDQESGIRAARAFWFLEYFGHPDVRLLDGGFDAWRRDGLPVTTTAAAPVPSQWTGRPDDSRLATWREVAAGLGRQDAVLLDTRTDGEYTGATVRASRGGAVPGAVHIEWTNNLGPDGAFKPASELRAMYEAAGVTRDREVMAYCQGGYRAAHSYLALRLIGYPRLRIYLGSWKEWGDRSDLPIEHPKGN